MYSPFATVFTPKDPLFVADNELSRLPIKQPLLSEYWPLAKGKAKSIQPVSLLVLVKGILKNTLNLLPFSADEFATMVPFPLIEIEKFDLDPPVLF
tara:strand:+ start:502 stop:789 length:288 start_codon:yes stop_codon:yes gene_type:complete